MSASGTIAEGDLFNPITTYEGVEGTAIVCIYADDGTYTTNPDSGNIASMPCIDDAYVHFATSVPLPNANAVAYLGMALSNGPNRFGD